MIQVLTSWLMAAIMVGHGLLGCCAHHTHAESTVCQKHMAHIHVHSEGHCDSHSHPPTACGDHHGQDAPPGPDVPSDCDEAPCVFLRSDSDFSGLLASAYFGAQLGMICDAILWRDSATHLTSAGAEHRAVHVHFLSAVRPHARFQIWLI